MPTTSEILTPALAEVSQAREHLRTAVTALQPHVHQNIAAEQARGDLWLLQMQLTATLRDLENRIRINA
jgi:hypothetical protein